MQTTHTSPAVNAMVPDVVLLPDGKSSAFQLLNIEYFSLCYRLNDDAIRKSLKHGLSNQLMHSYRLHKTNAAWQADADIALNELTQQLMKGIRGRQKQLPIAGLQAMPKQIPELKHALHQNPDHYLSHFQLGWLHMLQRALSLAERHFNIAALQSQIVNPQFASFAYRYLANVRYQRGLFDQALLAIESARECCSGYCAQLHYEYICLLSRTDHTTQGLRQLHTLLGKAPYYEAFARSEPDLTRNPSFQLLFNQRRQRHIQTIEQSLSERWENDPIGLLNLDQELGRKNSIQALRHKQHQLLMQLPNVLLIDTMRSCALIEKQRRQYVMRALNARKQQFIETIEEHQECASTVHQGGQWLIFAAVVALLALAVSYAISFIAGQFALDWPINLNVQNIVLVCAAVLATLGMLLWYFTPRKLRSLMRKRQQLERLYSRIRSSA